MKKLIITIIKKFNAKNISSTIDAFSRGTDAFNKAVQDFGYSMDVMTKEISSDIEKSKNESEAREKRNKENLDKIWGKKDDC